MATRKPRATSEYKTALQVAKDLGIDRTTLVRMHARKDIPECKVWGSKPQPHRLYSATEIAAIARVIEKNKRGKAPEGVKFIEGVDHEQA